MAWNRSSAIEDLEGDPGVVFVISRHPFEDSSQISQFGLEALVSKTGFWALCWFYSGNVLFWLRSSFNLIWILGHPFGSCVVFRGDWVRLMGLDWVKERCWFYIYLGFDSWVWEKHVLEGTWQGEQRAQRWWTALWAGSSPCCWRFRYCLHLILMVMFNVSIPWFAFFFY